MEVGSEVFERDVSNLIYIERSPASTAWPMLTSSLPKGKSEKVGLCVSLWYTFYLKHILRSTNIRFWNNTRAAETMTSKNLYDLWTLPKI